MRFSHDPFSRSSETIFTVVLFATAYKLCVIMKANDQLSLARVGWLAQHDSLSLQKSWRENG